MYDMIEEIKTLPHFRTSACLRCRTPLRIHALQIYATCPSCGQRFKCRAFGAIGIEIQDVKENFHSGHPTNLQHH